MNPQAETALRFHCRLALETVHPRFARMDPAGFSIVLTVNSGYEWLEQGFGGPVWHVSVAPRRPFYGATLCERRAVVAVDGLGDPRRGEWRDWTGYAFHLRRRLSAAEEVGVGPAVDVRGTAEAQRRARAVGRRLAAIDPAIVAAELDGTVPPAG